MQEYAQQRILAALTSGGELSWKDLKKATGLSDSTLAKYIKRLLEEGKIVERIDIRDRRRRFYSLADSADICFETLEFAVALYFVSRLNFMRRIHHDVDIVEFDRSKFNECAQELGKFILVTSILGGELTKFRDTAILEIGKTFSISYDGYDEYLTNKLQELREDVKKLIKDQFKREGRLNVERIVEVATLVYNNLYNEIVNAISSRLDLYLLKYEEERDKLIREAAERGEKIHYIDVAVTVFRKYLSEIVKKHCD